MQVERTQRCVSGERVSNTWATYPRLRDNTEKFVLIRYKTTLWHHRGVKDFIGLGWAHAQLASWWGNSSPRRRLVADLREWSATLELRYGPDSYGRQQWGILGNGGNPYPAMPREWRRSSDCKALWLGTKQMTVPKEQAPANYVPAAAVIHRGQALSGMTGRKGWVGGFASWKCNT